MSFKKFLDAYYTEEYLSGEFTFGFELEGFHTKLEDFQAIVADYFGEGASKIAHDSSVGNRSGECPTCHGWGRDDENNVECPDCEGSGLKETQKQCKGDSFEWASPVFQFTPSNLSKVVKFFEVLNNSNQFDINESCGFHVHVGMPTKFNVQEEWFWVLCHLAVGDIIDYSAFKKFGDWNFFSENYASTKFLSSIKKYLETNRMDNLAMMFDEEKFNVFRIHPQGTLEWRGPRGFISSNSLVKKFFLGTLPALIKFLSQAQHDATIKAGSYSYSKKYIFELVKTKARQTEYMYRKHTESNKRFHYSISNNMILAFLKIFPWLKKGKFTQLLCSSLQGNPKLAELSQGEWLGGDCYGVVEGSLHWKAPKENFKGFWISGYIDGKYQGINGGALYFDYGINQRQKAIFGEIKYPPR